MLVTIVHLNGSYKDIINDMGGKIVRTDPDTNKIDVQFDTNYYRTRIKFDYVIIRSREEPKRVIIENTDFCTIEIGGGGKW